MLLAFIISIFSAAQGGASVSLRDLTPIITAFSGIATGFIAARRSVKSDKVEKEQTEVTSLISGYTSQIAAYSSIVGSLQDEVLRLRTQFDFDRKMWEEQKISAAADMERMQAKTESNNDMLLKKIANLEADLADQKKLKES